MSRSLAIIIGFTAGFAIFSIALLVGAKVFDLEAWNVVTAIGTLLAGIGTVAAVLAALFYPLLLARMRRPILEVGFFEPNPPHLRHTPATDRHTYRPYDQTRRLSNRTSRFL